MKDIFGHVPKGFYIARFHYLPWSGAEIFAVYLSSDKLKWVVESFLLFDKESELKILEPTGLLVGVPDLDFLVIDRVNCGLRLAADEYHFKNKSFRSDEFLPKYTKEDLQKDLRHQSGYDIASWTKFFENSFRQIADITHCQKLKEDMCKYGGQPHE